MGRPKRLAGPLPRLLDDGHLKAARLIAITASGPTGGIPLLTLVQSFDTGQKVEIRSLRRARMGSAFAFAGSRCIVWPWRSPTSKIRP